MHTEASRENFSFVKESLFQFITSHVPKADLSVIDDIILAYVYSTFEGGSEEFYSQLNEIVPDFVDMMNAYVTDFNKIERNDVYSWMIHVVHRLDEMSKIRAKEGKGGEGMAPEKQLVSAAAAAEKPKKSNRTNSTSEDEKDPNAEKTFSVFYENEACYMMCHQLQEMFPETNPMEIKHCITIAFGDIDEAAAAVLHRRESGQALECCTWQIAAKIDAADDSTVKHRIIDRYSYVDKESGAKEHKPLAPKHEPKKMVRYRDNKIVSLKGERFTEVAKFDEDGVKKSSKKHP